jgi:tRNA pseudouridine55 synthase
VISGVLLLDKPAGYSSNQALGRAKRLIGERKAGHTGTLDPFATGLLPICFGEATKFSSDLLDADKAYRATACLGVRTDTGDTEGQEIARREVNITGDQVEAALSHFRGVISQVPPMYSALKRNGRPLYELARQGIEVERAARIVTIHRLELVQFEANQLQFDVTCSKGTYVRTLAEDIGEVLGCGAHLVALRRTLVGSLQLSDAVTLEKLEALSLSERLEQLAPVDYLLQGLRRVDLDAVVSARFLQGQRLRLDLEDGVYAVHGVRASGGEMSLLGTASSDNGVLRPKRLTVVEQEVRQS